MMTDALLIGMIAAGAALLFGGVAALLARAAQPSGDGERAAQDALIGRVEDCLPKTQCAQCGYPGCRPYAEAILADEVGIDQCPPGGTRTIEALATLLGRDVLPITNGAAGVMASLASLASKEPHVARIVEADCIGCALCLPACPTDAIVGAHKLMHTVIAADCTGCELCLAPCPVDCIVMLARGAAPAPYTRAEPAAGFVQGSA